MAQRRNYFMASKLELWNTISSFSNQDNTGSSFFPTGQSINAWRLWELSSSLTNWLGETIGLVVLLVHNS